MIKYRSERRWVDLGNLPHFEFNNELHIRWEDSVGCTVPFQYDNVVSKINIVGYKTQITKDKRHRAILSILIDKYVDKPIDVRSDFITNCMLHDVVSNRIADFAPNLIQYLENPYDAYKYSYQSNQKISTRCPICGHLESKLISNLYKYGFTCPCTSDGISIPNRIMFNILQQLNIDFISEVNKGHGFLWMKNYFYDFYFKLNDENILIEMDGFFHQFQQERDRIKTELAKDNQFKLIRIDCIYNNTDAIEYIKYNIINSELSTLLSLDTIAWNECKNAIKTNIMSQACELWELENLSVSQIADKLHVDRHTITKYLRRGQSIYLCPSYNTDESRRRAGRVRSQQYKMINNEVV